MDKEKVKSLLQTQTEKLLKGLCVEFDEVSVLEKHEGFLVNIKTKPSESKFLIGQHGVNLSSFQHLLRILVRRQHDERISFAVDVDNYKKNRDEYLKNLAVNAKEKAKNKNELVVLEPMPAGDRRIIHLEIAHDDEVKSESIGEGKDRRIAIKPVQQ